MKRITNFREALTDRFGKNFANDIATAVRQYPEDFDKLYPLIRCGEEKISWRAAWVCECLSASHPQWFMPRYGEITGILFTSPHTGLRRCLLSVLYTLPLPGEFPMQLYDYCIGRMLAPDEAIANQALCIKLAYKLGCAEPELHNELRVYLENAEPDYYSSGVKCVIKNTLKQLSRHKRDKTSTDYVF